MTGNQTLIPFRNWLASDASSDLVLFILGSDQFLAWTKILCLILANFLHLPIVQNHATFEKFDFEVKAHLSMWKQALSAIIWIFKNSIKIITKHKLIMEK